MKCAAWSLVKYLFFSAPCCALQTMYMYPIFMAQIYFSSNAWFGVGHFEGRRLWFRVIDVRRLRGNVRQRYMHCFDCPFSGSAADVPRCRPLSPSPNVVAYDYEPRHGYNRFTRARLGDQKQSPQIDATFVAVEYHRYCCKARCGLLAGHCAGAKPQAAVQLSGVPGFRGR